jgi:hypothetical protein
MEIKLLGKVVCETLFPECGQTRKHFSQQKSHLGNEMFLNLTRAQSLN